MLVKNYSYFIARALTASASFALILIASLVLDTETYSQILAILFLAKFLSILSLGGTTGYFIAKYTDNVRLIGEHTTEVVFFRYYIIQLMTLSLILFLLSSIYIPVYSMPILGFMIIAPLYAIEPLERYRRNFIFSLTPDIVLSKALLFIIVGLYLGLFNNDIDIIFLSVGMIMSTIIFTRTYLKYKKNDQQVFIKFSFRNYISILKIGIPVYLTSAIYMCVISADRLILMSYATEEVAANYMLSQQLVLGSMIFAAANNFTNSVNLGEEKMYHKQIPKQILIHHLKKNFLITTCSYLLLIGGTYLFVFYTQNKTFHNLPLYTISLGVGYGAFFIAGSISPVVGYYQRQGLLNLMLGASLLVVILCNICVYYYNLSSLILALCTTLILIIYSLAAIKYTLSLNLEQDMAEA